MSWRVARMDVRDLEPAQRDAVLDWVTRHGVDVDDVMPRLTVSYDEGRMLLHLSRFVCEAGAKVPDHNLDVMATTPLVVEINPDDPPPWMKEH